MYNRGKYQVICPRNKYFMKRGGTTAPHASLIWYNKKPSPCRLKSLKLEQSL